MSRKGDKDRLQLLQKLKFQPFIDTPFQKKNNNTGFWHGRLMTDDNDDSSFTLPTCTWTSHQKPRDDHEETAEWLTASEYNDTEQVLNAKLDMLAKLLRVSQKTVVYSGAGISLSAGIGQAARGSSNRYGSNNSKNKTTTTMPTPTHHALAALAKHNFIHGWVQQNHDGLPQKAGFPQECINEVHGSWYDPANPVVLYSGDLKQEEFVWMKQEAKSADLVVVVGTSLGGLNADQVALKPAERSRRGRSLGMVLINLQQTEHDGKSSLRVFGNTDHVFPKLLEIMQVPFVTSVLPPISSDTCRRFLIPYDEHGNPSSTNNKIWLDLSPGARVQLHSNHNLVGSGQPSYQRVGTKGLGTVTRWSPKTMAVEIKLNSEATVLLGQWWIEALLRGGPATCPIINIPNKKPDKKRKYQSE